MVMRGHRAFTNWQGLKMDMTNQQQVAVAALHSRLRPEQQAAASVTGGREFRDRFIVLAGLANEVGLQDRLAVTITERLGALVASVPADTLAGVSRSLGRGGALGVADDALVVTARLSAAGVGDAREVAAIGKAADTLRGQARWTSAMAASMGVIAAPPVLGGVLTAAAEKARDVGQVQFFSELGRVRGQAGASMERAMEAMLVAKGERVVVAAPAVAVGTPPVVGGAVVMALEKGAGGRAAAAVQGVLSAAGVAVSTAGEASLPDRNALLCVAAQAVEKRVVGFGVDGLDGKYVLDASLQDVHALYQAAGGVLAEQSVRGLMGNWAAQQPLVGPVPAVVDDKVRRGLNGPVSMEMAQTVMAALQDGSLYRSGAREAETVFAVALKDKGIDIRAPSLEAQAREFGLTVMPPDRERGLYVGRVMAQDHSASVVKSTRTEAIILRHAEVDQKLAINDSVRVQFDNGAVSVTMTGQKATQTNGQALTRAGR